MKKFLAIFVPILLLVIFVGVFFLYNYTEIFGKKIIPIKVNNVSIMYYPNKMDNILDKDGNSVVSEQEIKISSKNLKEVSSLLKKVKINKNKISNKTFLSRVIINKDYILYINEKEGYIKNKKDNTNVVIPNSLYNYVYTKIEENNNKIFNKIDLKNIIIHGSGTKISVNNKDNLKILKESINYLPININEDFDKYNDGYKYTLDIDDNTHLFIYSNNVGYLTYTNDSSQNKYVILKKDVYKIVNEIYDISTNEKKK